MGNYRARRPGFLEAWKINAAELMFRGFTDEQIIKQMWPLPEGTEDKKRYNHTHNKKQILQRLRKDPKFQEYYNSIITEWKVHNVGPALRALNTQVLQEKDLWLQNKAANDILNHTKELHTSDEENTVTIRFEGMPEIGEPGE